MGRFTNFQYSFKAKRSSLVNNRQLQQQQQQHESNSDVIVLNRSGNSVVKGRSGSGSPGSLAGGEVMLLKTNPGDRKKLASVSWSYNTHL